MVSILVKIRPLRLNEEDKRYEMILPFINAIYTFKPLNCMTKIADPIFSILINQFTDTIIEGFVSLMQWIPRVKENVGTFQREEAYLYQIARLHVMTNARKLLLLIV